MDRYDLALLFAVLPPGIWMIGNLVCATFFPAQWAQYSFWGWTGLWVMIVVGAAVGVIAEEKLRKRGW